MSSEPGLEHTSAHDDPDDAVDIGDGIQDEPAIEHVAEDEPTESGWGPEEEEEELESVASGTDGLTVSRTRHSQAQYDAVDGSAELPSRPRVDRPASFESTSTPDDTPSIPGSLVSSPRSSVAYSYNSPRANRPALQPFERRFSSRLSPSPLATPRGASPAFLSAHSRQSSLSSNLLFQQLPDEADTPQAPWEVVRWTKLKKITAQVFSEVGKRNFGRPTCLNVAASLVIGTSKGFILVFDYQQVLKSIIGPGTKGKSHRLHCFLVVLTVLQLSNAVPSPPSPYLLTTRPSLAAMPQGISSLGSSRSQQNLSFTYHRWTKPV